MRRALELARLGLGRVHPNPIVGAVVVCDGVIAGEGFHGAYGGPHAEVYALQSAGAAAAGATLYVTLEPCAHHGKTPPCTDAILAAGVRRVVHAASDPNPQARGGAAVLRDAGLEVQGGVEEAAARAQNAAFFHRHEHESIFVAMKLAITLDGRLAAAPGVRTQITGAPALAEVHRLRASHDAVLTGSGTARIDDPLLTVRTVQTSHVPVRVVLDTSAQLPLSSALVRTVADAPLWLLCAHDADATRVQALRGDGVNVIHCARDEHGLELGDVLARLHDHGIRSILAESGSALAASLLRARRVHRLYLFIAPTVLGLDAVPAFTEPLGGSWHTVDCRQFADDALITLASGGVS